MSRRTRELDSASGAGADFRLINADGRPCRSIRGWSASPLIEHVEGRIWAHHRRLRWIAPSGTPWVVPEGLHSDGASRPWIVGWLLPRWGVGAAAAGLHDALYRYGASLGVSRATADRLFREALIDEGLARWRAWGAWAGVRVFGWLAWRNQG